MSISAYLDEDQDETVETLKEELPVPYKAIADNLSINQAEQSIIDEVVGVDGSDEDEEKDEAEAERDMKTLFESLYEIDPDTKEVFVKGSAYDLKKWEDDMVCFTFGSPDRCVAMEDSISPEERRLTMASERLNAKSKALAGVIRKHSDTLRARTVSKAFARDFNEVMGRPFIGSQLRMESFTTEPSATNYHLAMEEMGAVQMAVAAGAALAGVGIVYKMIQWFSKSLNRNGETTGKITENFSNYKERKNKIESAGKDAQLDAATIDKVVAEVRGEVDDGDAKNADTALNDLKEKMAKDLAASLRSGDAKGVFKKMNNDAFCNKLFSSMTPFHVALLSGKIKKEWWETLGKLIDQGLASLDTMTANLETISSATELDNGKPDLIDFSFLTSMNELNITALISNEETKNFKSWDKNTNNWEEAINAFMAVAGSLTTKYANFTGLELGSFDQDAIENIDLTIFNKFSQDKIDKLVSEAEKLKTQSAKTYQEMKDSGKTDARVEKRRDRINILTKEFKAVANVIRFVIQIRNQLGNLSVALEYSSQKTIGIMEKIGMVSGSALSGLKSSFDSMTKGHNKAS